MFFAKRVRDSRAAKIVGAPSPSPAPPPAARLWSVAAGWPGGVLPGPTSDVVIPADDAVMQDVNVTVRSLTVMGDLYGQDTGPLTLTSGYVVADMGGRIEYGTSATPRVNQLRVTVNGTSNNVQPRIKVDITARAGAANTKLLKLWSSAGAVTETITVSYGNPSTSFLVSGSISGNLGSGTDGTPFNNRVRFVSSGTRASGDTITIRMQAQGFTGDSLPRSIQRMAGADMSFVGVAPANPVVRATAHIMAGSNVAQVDADVSDWRVGDEVIVCPTDYPGFPSGTPQKMVVQSVTASSVTFTAGVTAFRWGLPQYVTDAGLSLTPGTLTNSENAPAYFWDITPKVLDERCRLVNISRNIKFECPDDTSWQNDGYGVHTMVMGNAGTAEFVSVEIIRGGQEGVDGRYPFHWHMNSYAMPDGMTLPSSGVYTADVPNTHRVHKCSTNGSKQRAITLHGVCGLAVTQNIMWDTGGHALFMEDGSERRNFIQGNVVVKVTSPMAARKLLQHDFDGPNFSGPSGFWLTNPDNVIESNEAYGVKGAGFHNSFAFAAFGLSRDVPINPNGFVTLSYNNNRSFCNGRPMFLDGLTLDELGNTFLQKYHPTSDGGRFVAVRDLESALNGAEIPTGNEVDFFIRRTTGFKNLDGYSNRAGKVNYEGWSLGGNIGSQFKGAVEYRSFARGNSVWGTTLNNATTPQMVDANAVQCGFATYHGALHIDYNIGGNFPPLPPITPIPERNEAAQGFIAAIDLYTNGWFDFKYFTQGNKLINSRLMYVSRPPHIDTFTSNDGSHFTFAGAMAADVFGRAGGTHIFDVPFFTYGLADLQDVDVNFPNGKTTMQTAYGITPIFTDVTTAEWGVSAQNVTVHQWERLNPANHAQVVGSWRLGQGVPSKFLEALRPSTLMKDGVYRVLHEKTTYPTQYAKFSVENLWRTTDSAVVAIPWSGSVVPRGGAKTYLSGANIPASAPDSRLITNATSKAAFEASTDGTLCWLDASNNLLWIRLRGGLAFDASTHLPDSQYNVWRAYNYYFEPA